MSELMGVLTLTGVSLSTNDQLFVTPVEVNCTGTSLSHSSGTLSAFHSMVPGPGSGGGGVLVKSSFSLDVVCGFF